MFCCIFFPYSKAISSFSFWDVSRDGNNAVSLAGSALVPIGPFLVTWVSLALLLKMNHTQIQCCGRRARIRHRQKHFSSELRVWLLCEKGVFHVGPTAELMNECYSTIDFYPKKNRVNLSPSLGQIALCRLGSKQGVDFAPNNHLLGRAFPEISGSHQL